MDPQPDDEQPPENKQVNKQQKAIGTAMIAAMWVVLLILLSVLFEDVIDEQMNPNQELSTRYIGDSVREVELQRNRFGHYVTDGSINGQPVVFMLDTGATGVAIPDAIARQLGLKAGPAYRTRTANGVTTAYATRLDSVGIDDIELQNVKASIVPGYKADEILLGMSFLQHIEFSQKGDRLILRQKL